MAKQERDYYDVLGVSRTASADEIRKAYRKLARQYHPDVNKAADAAAKFQEVQEAYDVLSDAQKRKTYDQFGRADGPGSAGGPGGWGAGPGPGPGPGPGGVRWSSRNVSPEDLGDVGSIFEEMFGGRGAAAGGRSPFGGYGAGGPAGAHASPRPQPRRGPDIQHQLTVDFMTAALGGETSLRLSGPHGADTISVKIPPGVETGSRLRIRGRGQPGVLGGEKGDLILTLTVQPHPWFRRDGLDLSVDVPITLAEAVQGATVTVPLLKGSIDLKIPPGSSSGRKLRVKGQGVHSPTGRGDFYAVVQIAAPKDLTERGQELIEELAGELQDPRESAPWSETARSRSAGE